MSKSIYFIVCLFCISCTESNNNSNVASTIQAPQTATNMKVIEQNVENSYKTADKKLNIAYQKLISNSNINKDALVFMQRSWIQYRDSKCDTEFPIDKAYGSIAKTEHILCKETATKLQMTPAVKSIHPNKVKLIKRPV